VTLTEDEAIIGEVVDIALREGGRHLRINPTDFDSGFRVIG